MKLGIGILIGFAVGCILMGLFIPARDMLERSAKIDRRMSDAAYLSRAVFSYTEKHQGKLPDGDWKSELIREEPSLREVLTNTEDHWQVGFAAVPGTLGKKIDDLAPETFLFVGYRAWQPMAIISDMSEIGTVNHPGMGVGVTVEDLTSGRANRSWPIARIGYQLARQNVPGLK